jgi:predicted nucleic acid-binding protein
MVERIFVDANILFSAAWSTESRVALLFDLARVSGAELLASPFVIEEATRNLALKRPAHARYLERIPSGIRVVPNGRPIAGESGYGLPDKDRPVLRAAISAQSTVLVTGDVTHFGHLYGRVVEGVLVTTVADALRRLVDD